MKIDSEKVYKDFCENNMDDSNRKLLSSIHETLTEEGFVCKFKTGLRYYLKGKKEFLIFYCGNNGSSRIKIRLAHIESYEQEIAKCSETVKNHIYNEKECNHCGDCSTQIHLNHNGKEISICNPTWWWVGFYFKDLQNLSKEDKESILKLIKLELPFYKDKLCG